MKYILLLLTSIAISCNTIKKIQVEEIQTSIVACVKNDLQQDTTLCPYFEKQTIEQKLGFYESELSYFPIEKITEILQGYSHNYMISKKDTLGLTLFYPLVGFDPEVGYETSYMLYGPSFQQEAIFGKYDTETQRFSNKRITKLQIEKTITNFQNIENDCGTGYLIHFNFSLDFKHQECICAYDLGI